MITTGILSGSAYPTIRVNLGKKIFINKAALRCLGSPENIHFWWSESEKVLLISSAPEKTPLSHSVGKYCYSPRQRLRIQNRDFMAAIMKITNWRAGTIYKIMGEYVPEIDMVAYRINDAMELKDFSMEEPVVMPHFSQEQPRGVASNA